MAHRTASGATPRRRHGELIQFSVIGDAVRERFRKGRLSQQGCQQTWRRQRRNWRVRAVERGQRSEPTWLRAHPGLHYFEPEKPPRTQIPRNVWDTGTAGMGDGVNYNSERNLAKRRLALRHGHVSNFCLKPHDGGSGVGVTVGGTGAQELVSICGVTSHKGVRHSMRRDSVERNYE